ncbi:hypothetical protein GCM10020254_27150 [Streptomyces goshikiensis]
MRDGRIAQAGTPLEVWQRPASEFVARFLGFENVVPATVSGGAAVTAWGKVPVPAGSPEGERSLLIRPAGVVLAAAGLGCEVLSRTFRGTHVALLLRPEAGPPLEAECTLAGGAGRRGPGRGDLRPVRGGRPAAGVTAARNAPDAGGRGPRRPGPVAGSPSWIRRRRGCRTRPPPPRR